MTPPRDRDLWRALWPFLRADLGLWSFSLALAPITAGAAILQPMLFKSAIDDHLAVGRIDGLSTLVAALAVTVALGFVAQVAHTWLLSVAATRTITAVRRAVTAHLLGLPAAFFDREPSGKLLTRATSDVEALGETLNAGAFTLILDALQVLGVVGAMFWLDARLSLVLLLVGPPLAVVLNALRRRLRALFAETHTTQATLNAWISERFDTLETVQLLADEPRAIAGFDRRLQAYNRTTIESNVWDALMFAVVDGVSAITTALILVASGVALAYATDTTLPPWLLAGVTPGLIAAFLDYLSRLFVPVQEFSQKVAVLQRAAAALDKIVDLLHTDEAIPDGPVALPHARGDVAFEGVSFAYTPGHPVLTDVSFPLRHGEVVALVGRTGSGKTTLASLLSRAYDGWEGRITLDGHDLRQLRVRDLRAAIASVRQDVQVFPDTVRFNLTLGRDVSDAALQDALRLARADGIVDRLGGLDATLAAGGRNLSAGEAQLLAMARVLAHDPAVVVLDEATASVDSLTEALLQAATEAVLATKTTLVIAHRLSTVLRAHRIVLLDAGRVVEMGTHDELIARDGAYASLFREQALHAPVEAPVTGA